MNPFPEVGILRFHCMCFDFQMVTNNYNKILIFEDDVRFKESFRPKMEALLQEIQVKNLDWELL